MPTDDDCVVCMLIAAVANVDLADVSHDAELSGLGLDSIGVMEVLFRCEDHFGRTILNSGTPEVHTVDDIVALVGLATAPL